LTLTRVKFNVVSSPDRERIGGRLQLWTECGCLVLRRPWPTIGQCHGVLREETSCQDAACA
jgi:hypothetical protein